MFSEPTPFTFVVGNVFIVAVYTLVIHLVRLHAPLCGKVFRRFESHNLRALQLLRFVMSIVIALIYFHRQYLDYLLDFLWKNFLKENWFIQHRSAEACVSTYAFGLYYAIFLAIDISGVLNRYRFTTRNRTQIAQIHNNFSEYFYAPMFYLLPILIYHYFYPGKIVSENSPTVFSFTKEIFLMLIFYDIYFISLHMTAHFVPILYRNIHRCHHSNQDLYASDTFRFTLVDFWMNVFPSIWAVHTFSHHTLSPIIYDALLTWLLVVNHSGYDLLFSLENILTSCVFNGPRTHSSHHQQHASTYSQFFPFLDVICGTNTTGHSRSTGNLLKNLLLVFVTGCSIVFFIEDSRLNKFLQFYSYSLASSFGMAVFYYGYEHIQ